VKDTVAILICAVTLSAAAPLSAQNPSPQTKTGTPSLTTASIQVEAAGPERTRVRLTMGGKPWILESAGFTFDHRDGGIVITSNGPVTLGALEPTATPVTYDTFQMTISSGGAIKFRWASKGK